MKIARDTWLIFQRQSLLVLRNPVWLIVGIVQPLFYLVLFAPLLKSALHTTSNADAYRIFVPGLLVLLAMFGPLFTGFALIAELRAGVIERSRVTPVSRLALLLGRSLRDVVSLLVQAVLLTVVALAFGLSVNLGDVLLAYLLLALIALMLSAVSYATALYRLGYAYGKTNKVAEARGVLEEAVKIPGPYQAPSRDLLATVNALGTAKSK